MGLEIRNKAVIKPPMVRPHGIPPRGIDMDTRSRLFEGRFEWSVAHRTGMTQYLLAWPRLARTVAAVEPRLPKACQMALVVFARKR